MGIPADHASYLQRKDYVPPQPDQFTSEELNILARFGHWMEALTRGAIEPVTPDQCKFRAVAQGQGTPETPFERVWTKLRKLHRPSTPPPPEFSEEAPLAEASYEKPPHGSTVEAKLEEFAEARAYLADLRQQEAAERKAILKPVQAQLDALEEQSKQEMEDAKRAVEELEAELRAEILKIGKNVQWENVAVTCYMGRVTWDDKYLLKYAETHPELMRYRKVGNPWTRILFLDK